MAVDGVKAVTADEFLSLIEAKRPGDEVLISVVRQGQQQDTPLRLGESEP